METVNHVKTNLLPRWEELPDLDLYMDQVLSLTDRYLAPLSVKPITASMINNYVKLKLIPPTKGKRYSRVHVAFIFAIAVLKDVFEIAQIREGILIETNVLGLKNAYNLFTIEIESAIRLVEAQSGQKEPIALIEGEISDANKIMKFAALSFATQRHAKALIQFNKQGETNHE